MEEDFKDTETLLSCTEPREREEVFARLFMHHSQRLRTAIMLRFDHRLWRRVGVSDVISETYVEARERLEEYLKDPRLPLYLWLRFLAIQKLKGLYRFHVRTKQRDVRREVPLERRTDSSSTNMIPCPDAPDKSPSQIMMTKEKEDRFRAALAGMDRLDREIIFLRHFEQLSSSETARVVGLQDAAVRQRHARALKKLKEALREVAQEGSGYWR